MENIKVITWGAGAMGGGISRMIAEKEGIEIVGAIVGRPESAGKDLGEHLGINNLGVITSNNPEEVFGNCKADIVIIATDSFTKNVFPQIKLAVENGVNVITIAEEMAYPHTVESKLSKEIDRLARENNVTVLGTGVNPGFVLDTLIIVLSAGCRRVDRIKAARINDLSPFGGTVMRTQGVGTTVDEFNRGIKEGTIVGHIGFMQSIPMIADALGIEIDDVIETREPIISNIYRETPYVVVKPGMVAGCKHIGYGMRNGEAVITLEHPQQIHPQLENVDTGDYIFIEGDPSLNLSIKPETPGGIGTIAMAVNMIPQVINHRPGLVSMIDLPLPHALMGDLRKFIKK